MRHIDDLFEMGGGYVLDFSDRTFREFFCDELNIDIEDRIYEREGTSKAKRLRCFLRTVDVTTAIRTLKALWEHREAVRIGRNREEWVPNAQGLFLQLIDRLEGKSASVPHGGTPPIPAFERAKFVGFKEGIFALSTLPPHPRGYAFEKFLRELFNAFGLNAREPFRLLGEQIDGSFILGNETYSVEAKWQNLPIGAQELHSFHGKLEQKAAWTRGVFISYNGFSIDGLKAFGKGKRVICVDGADLYESFNREIPLPHLLERKVRGAAESGEPYIDIQKLFP